MTLKVQKLFLSSVALLAAGFSLMGCERTKETFGMSRMTPDEFQVVDRAPLTMPPDFNLTPPKKGEENYELSSSSQAQERAQDLILGEDTALKTRRSSDSSYTKGTQALLGMAQADKASPDIRKVVANDNKAYVKAEKRFVDKLIFWQEPAPLGDVVNPAAEAERVKENQKTGKSLTDGKTPVIKRKNKSPLEEIF